MPSIAALSAAALLASLSAPPPTPPDVPGRVSMAAGSSRWSAATGTYLLEDDVVLRRGALILRARSATYDPASGEVTARGSVLVLDGGRALLADEVHALLGGPFQAERVTAVLKQGQADLSAAASFAAARAVGVNRATVSGERVDGDEAGRLQVESARVTLCDCGAGCAPSWELRARRADVIPGKRATLSWPVLYVTPRIVGVGRPVPVLAVPWIYLPLGERQTGLLAPEIGSTGKTGWSYSQPLYVTLGRSADATVTPEYFFGPGDGHRKQGAVRGPGARLELRFAPAQNALGELELRWVHDLDREPGGGFGDRLALEGRHGQDLSERTRLRARLALYGDPVLVRDFGAGQGANEAYYALSDALVSHRGEDLTAELSAAYLEPLTPIGIDEDHPGRPPGLRFGVFGGRMPVLHRLPSAALALAPVSLGPFLLQGRAGVTRFAPIEGHRGALAPDDPGAHAGLGPEALAASEREAVTRAEARVELSLPLSLAGVRATPFVRGAALGYAFDSGGELAGAAWGLGGLTLSADLSRRYGAALHTVTPSVELLAGSGNARTAGGVRSPAYDLWDRTGSQAVAPAQRLSAAPSTGPHAQLRAGLASTIAAGPAGTLHLGLSQDLDVRNGRFAESTLTVNGARGPFTMGGRAAVLAFSGHPRTADPALRSRLDAFTRLEGNAALRDGRGDGLTAVYQAVGPGEVGAQAAGTDALFDLRPSSQAGGAVARLGAQAVLSGARLGYEVQLAARRTDVACPGAIHRRDAGEVLAHGAELVWDSPCHCFTASVKLSLDACGDLHQSFSLDLSRLMQGARTP